MTPDQFKATRKRLGFTQAELAEEWGVHVQSISKWERGVDPISPLALRDLYMCRVFTEFDLKPNNQV